MYRAHRDYRFEYAHDVIYFLEEHQCGTCVFRNDDPEMPMCFEIAGAIVTEEPVAEIQDMDDQGVWCQKYKEGTPTPPQVEGQEELF
jgi:hypothetical protein